MVRVFVPITETSLAPVVSASVVPVTGAIPPPAAAVRTITTAANQL